MSVKLIDAILVVSPILCGCDAFTFIAFGLDNAKFRIHCLCLRDKFAKPNMASDIIDIRKDMHGISTQMKKITDILKKQSNMKQADTNASTSPPLKRRTGKKGTGSVSSNEETRLKWASDCDSDLNSEQEKGERMIVTKDSSGEVDMEGSSAGAAFLK
jgi:hypothetical protein